MRVLLSLCCALIGFMILSNSYSGLRHVRELMKTKALQRFEPYRLDERYPTRDRVAPGVDPMSEEYDEERMRHLAAVLWHPAGTCKMGRREDPTAVVDPELL